MVLGDSHAQQLLTPIHRVADANNWRVISYLRNACRYASESDNRDEECNEFSAATRYEDLHSIDLTDRLCTETTCPGVIGNIQVYTDLDHVTFTYGETLAPDVEQRMRAALGWSA